MKKKSLLFVLTAVLALLLLAVSLVSCGEEHVHEKEELPYVPATCTQEGKGKEGYKCTTCGEILTPQATLPATGIHLFENGVCTSCGLVAAEHETQNLAFEASEDGSTYDVSGIGTATDAFLIIPTQYNSKPVIGIKENAFKQNNTITGVYIPGSVKVVGASAFRECMKLKSVTLADGVVSVENYAFNNCTAMKMVDLGETLNGIGDSAFEMCNALRSVVIPNSTLVIGEYAFGYSALSELQLGNRVNTIEKRAFYSNYLTEITIPSSVELIGLEAFRMTSLKKATFETNYGWIGVSDVTDTDGIALDLSDPANAAALLCRNDKGFWWKN